MVRAFVQGAAETVGQLLQSRFSSPAPFNLRDPHPKSQKLKTLGWRILRKTRRTEFSEEGGGGLRTLGVVESCSLVISVFVDSASGGGVLKGVVVLANFVSIS